MAYIYILSSRFYARTHEYKIGCTMQPVERLWPYHTADPPRPDTRKEYFHLWRVHASSSTELRAIENHIHRHFRAHQFPDSEWFTCPLEQLLAFIRSLPSVIDEVPFEEVDRIHREAATRARTEEEKRTSDDTEKGEDHAKDEKNDIDVGTEEEHVEHVESLYEKFVRICCEGKPLRRIQHELWERMDTEVLPSLSISVPMYRGIIQWPTGTGKTIAILLLIVRIAEAYRECGRVYRGLLLSPTNDIFDTLRDKLTRLVAFGITVIDGSHGQFSTCTIPLESPVLILACHASLTDPVAFERLPPIDHVHYDEVHHITGDKLYTCLRSYLVSWGTRFITGTSATPKTTSKEQHRKLAELFQAPSSSSSSLPLLHQCTVEEAVREGWIAKPRFMIHLLRTSAHCPESHPRILAQFVDVVVHAMESKGRGGKAIVYIESSKQDVLYAYRYARETYEAYPMYHAIDDADTESDTSFRTKADDDVFCAAPVSPDRPTFLFACERYREGSDIAGVQLTARLVYETIASHLLIQISGRALRLDGDPQKEGWCLLARVIQEDDTETTEDAVLEGVLLEMAVFLGVTATASASSAMTPQHIRALVETYVGSMTIAGKTYSIEETVERIQAMYARRRFVHYDAAAMRELQTLCHAHGVTTSVEYHRLRDREMPEIPANPLIGSMTWYDFLHPNDPVDHRMTREVFMNQIIHPLQLYTAEEYTTRAPSSAPALQEIQDGYFGTTHAEFHTWIRPPPRRR